MKNNLHLKRDPQIGLWDALKMTICEFFKHSVFHGYKYLVEPRLSFLDKLCWAIVLVFTLLFSVYIATSGVLNFNENPTFTSLQSQQYPTSKVPFPAVCVCSINKISRKAALEYAEEL